MRKFIFGMVNAPVRYVITFFCLMFVFVTPGTFGQAPQWDFISATNQINDMVIYEDSIVMATAGGLAIFDRGEDTCYLFNHKNSILEFDYVHKVAADSAGVLWFVSGGANSHGKLFKLEGSQMSVFDAGSSSMSWVSDISDLKVDDSGNVWITVRFEGLYKFDGSAFSFFSVYYSNNNSVEIDNNSITWVADNNYPGIIRFDGTNFSYNLCPLLSGQSSSGSAALSKVSDGRIFLAIMGQAECEDWMGNIEPCPETVFARYDGSNWVQVAYLKDYGYSITGFMAEEDGTMWVSFGSKLYRVLNSQITLFDLSSKGINHAISIQKDNEGTIWVAGYYGLVSFDAGTQNWVRKDIKLSAMPSNSVNSIVLDSINNVWAAFSSAIGYYDRTQWTIYDSANTILSSQVLIDLAYTKSGKMWILSSSGLFRLYNGVWEVLQTIPGFGDITQFTNIIVDANGIVWIGGGFSPLIRIDDSDWSSTVFEPSTTGLNDDNRGLSMDVDSSNTLWVSDSYGKLVSYDGNSWETHPIQTIPSTVNSLRVNRKTNAIWFVNSTGLYSLKDDHLSVFRFSDYNVSINTTPYPKLEIDRTGNVWIGTRSLHMFDGEQFHLLTDGYSGVCLGDITDMVFDSDDFIWIGSRGGGILKMRAGFPYNFADTILIHGKVFFDGNGNEIMDPIESGMSSQRVLLMPDSITSLTNNSGNFGFWVDEGQYEVKFLPAPGWVTTTDSTSYHFCADTTVLPVMNFGTQGLEEQYSFMFDYFNMQPLRCGFDVSYYGVVKNTGTLQASVNVAITPDPLLQVTGFSAQPDFIANGKYYWNFEDLSPSQWRSFLIHTVAPDWQYMGDTIRSTYALMYENEQSSGGSQYYSTDTLCQVINCSYDPNDKQVTPEGILDEHYTLIADTLYYTIRFQNTGNDTAFNIVITDTLDLSLNLSSLEIVASSHPVEALLKDNIILFYFNDIFLPDSGRNESASHGFVRYRIKSDTSIMENTEVQNIANIYFDYNPAIVTNYVTNKMVSFLPQGVQDFSGMQNPYLFVYPQPADEDVSIYFYAEMNRDFILTLSDLSGKIVYSRKFTGSPPLLLKRNDLQSGIYIFNITSADLKIHYKGKILFQ
ncbi:MAG: T9SS type A sorting domain-containing protein [Bacteroidetes bacterium]|nr:T9SS type A sorting domain-containing protein [Bacteroidota bacterium]